MQTFPAVSVQSALLKQECLPGPAQKKSFVQKPPPIHATASVAKQ
jgi:hypothetical protein